MFTPPQPFAILRTEKIKSWSALAKSVGHNIRTSADDRKHTNPDKGGIEILLGSKEWVSNWRELVKEMWLPDLKQGTNHTLCREFFLGASPEFFAEKTDNEIHDWALENVAWLKRRFGEDRVKMAVLHTDENTPHIAAYVVGLKVDCDRKGNSINRGNGWTLSDGVLKLGGGKNMLSKLQDEYADAMRLFSLRRGIKKSSATHQTTANWRAQMARPLDQPVIKPRVELPDLSDHLDLHGYGKRVAEAAANSIFKQMKPYHQQAKARDREVRLLKGMIQQLEPLADAFKKLLERLLGRSPQLGTVEGSTIAFKAVEAFLKASAPEAELTSKISENNQSEPRFKKDKNLRSPRKPRL